MAVRSFCGRTDPLLSSLILCCAAWSGSDSLHCLAVRPYKARPTEGTDGGLRRPSEHPSEPPVVGRRLCSPGSQVAENTQRSAVQRALCCTCAGRVSRTPVFGAPPLFTRFSKRQKIQAAGISTTVHLIVDQRSKLARVTLQGLHIPRRPGGKLTFARMAVRIRTPSCAHRLHKN